MVARVSSQEGGSLWLLDSGVTYHMIGATDNVYQLVLSTSDGGVTIGYVSKLDISHLGQ